MQSYYEKLNYQAGWRKRNPTYQKKWHEAHPNYRPPGRKIETEPVLVKSWTYPVKKMIPKIKRIFDDKPITTDEQVDDILSSIDPESKVYWRNFMDNVIASYNSLPDDSSVRYRLENQIILPAIRKMIECALNRFKNVEYMFSTYRNISDDILSHLFMVMGGYNATKGRSFSYFSVCIRHWIQQKNMKGYKTHLKHPELPAEDTQQYLDKIMTHDPEKEEFDKLPLSEEYVKQLQEYWVNWFDAHFSTVVQRKLGKVILDNTVNNPEKALQFSKRGQYVKYIASEVNKVGRFTRCSYRNVSNNIQKINSYLYRDYIANGYIDTKHVAMIEVNKNKHNKIL